ncbi:hypothetical protein Q3C01_16955 [Bradyrhizobium sp. UFLA05-109]
MQFKRMLAGAVGGLILASASISPIYAAAGCTVDKLQGAYVFDGRGTNVHYGVFNFDGNGKFSGQQTSIRQTKSPARETLEGTYTINADCSGVMIMDGQPGGTAHWDIFVTSDGKKGRMIRTDAGIHGVRTFEQ